MRQNTQAVADLGKQVEATGKSTEALDQKLEKTGRTAKAAGKEVATAGAAAQGTAPALDNVGKSAGGAEPKVRALGDSAQRTAQQMRQVAPQMTDIVTSLVSGQSPFLVAIQQGGQLKDVFGGVGPAARALGSYIGGMVNPATLAAAAVSTLGVAYYIVAGQQSQFTNQILLSGNAVGLTTSQYYGMAAGLAAISGTKGAALEALGQMATQGRVAADNLQQFTGLAQQMDKLVGKPVADTVKEFAALAEAPVAASAKLNQAYNYLTAATYEEIRALVEQGRHIEAVNLAQQAYATELARRTPQMVENLGAVEQGWIAVKNAANAAAEPIMNALRAPSLQQQLAQVRQEIARAQGQDRNRPFSTPWDTSLAELREREAGLQRQEEAEKRAAAAARDRAEATAAAERWGKLIEGSLGNQTKLTNAILQAEADGVRLKKTRKEIEEAIAALKKKYPDTEGDAGLKDSLAARIATIRRGGEQEAIATREAIERVNAELRLGEKSRYEAMEAIAAIENQALERDRDRLAAQIAIAAQQKNSAREVADLEGQLATTKEKIAARGRKLEADIDAERRRRQKSASEFYEAERAQFKAEMDAAATQAGQRYDQMQLQVTQYVQLLSDENEETEFQISLMGKSAREEAKLIELRRISLNLRQQERQLDREFGNGKVGAAKYDAELARIRAAAAEAAAKVETQISVKEWKRADAEIGESLYLALTGRGREARQQLIQLFDDTVLRPNIEAVMSPVSGAISSMLREMVGGATNSFAQYLGMGSNSSVGSYMANGVSAALFGNAGAYASTVPGLTATGAGSQAAMLAAQTGEFGVAGLNATSAAGGGSAMGGAAYAAGAAAAVAVMAYAAAEAWQSTRGEKRGGARFDYDSLTGASTISGAASGDRAEGSDDLVKGLLAATSTSLNEAFKSFGSAVSVASVIGAYETSANGRGGVFSGVTLSDGTRVGEDGSGSNYQFTGPQDSKYEIWGAEAGRHSMFGNYDLNGDPAKLAVDIQQSYIAAIQASAGIIPRIVQETYQREISSSGAGFTPGSSGYEGSPDNSPLTTDPTATRWLRVFDDEMKQRAEELGLLPKRILDLIIDVDPETLSAEATAALTGKISALVANVNGFRAIVDAMPVDGLRDVSFDVAAALVEVSGGLEVLGTNLATYYQQFYSEEERAAHTTASLTSTLAGLGLQLPASRDGFRDLVEGQDLTTESGRKAYATLLGVAGAFAQVTPVAQAAQQAVVDQAKQQDLWIKVLELTGQSVAAQTAVRDRELAALDASLLPMQKYIYALQDEATARGQVTQAQQAVTTAQQQYRTALQAVADFVAAAAQDVADAEAKIAEIRSAAAQNVADATARVENAEESVRAAVQAIADALESAASRVERADEKIAEIRSAAAAAVSQAESELTDAEGNIAATLRQIADTVASAADRLGAAESKVAEIRAAAAQRVTELSSRLTAADDRVQAALRGVAQEIESAASRLAAAQGSVQGIRDRATDQYVTAQDAVADAQERVANLAEQAADRLRDLTVNLAQFLDSLSVTQLGGGSPESRYLAAKAQFESTSTSAIAGDAQAREQIRDVITTLLETSATYNASGDGFVADRTAAEVVLTQLIAAGQAAGDATGTAAGADAAAQAQEALQAALDKLAEAQAVVSQTGAATARSTQSLLDEYLTASVALQAAQDAHTALLEQTAGVDLQQLQQGATIASLLADLTAAHAERAQVQQQLAHAQDIAAQIGADTLQVQRDLLAEFTTAEAARLSAQQEYNLLLQQTAGVDLSVLDQTVSMSGLLEQLAGYQAEAAIAQARLTSAQEVANTVGVGAVEATRDLVAEFIAASTERDQAIADYNLALEQTRGVNFAVLENQTSIAALLANLDGAYTELGTARQSLLDAQAVATAVGANAADTVRDLVAEFNAAQGEYTTALARYNEALEQTNGLNFELLNNQRSLADLLGDLSGAATALDDATAALAAAEGALATAIANTQAAATANAENAAAASASQLVSGVYTNVLQRTGNMAPTQEELNYWISALGGTNAQETGVTAQNLQQRMVADAFGFEGDPIYGYVVDLLRAQGYKPDGSHASGLASVPWDNYRALLHKEERVLTAQDNRIFSSFDWSSMGRNDDSMAAEMQSLRSEVARLAQLMAQSNAGIQELAAVNADGHFQTIELLAAGNTLRADAPKQTARALATALEGSR
ncbi:MAG TPA: phage tail length tape measure family protein [Ramlibacter sp.]|nr:phage tail length tape measure family protein [Ramlibacter sp.]